MSHERLDALVAAHQAALEAQPGTTQNPKSLLDAILHAIETARVDVAQVQGPGGPSRSL